MCILTIMQSKIDSKCINIIHDPKIFIKKYIEVYLFMHS